MPPTANPTYQPRKYSIFKHRPHKTAIHYFNSLAATALFRIWPHLLFMGGWSAMIILVNLKTPANLSFAPTMITVLGVLLGLTLSYRTSSAYARYAEGRRLWANMTAVSRTWARLVWMHCPDSLSPEPLTDDKERAQDMALAIVEKKTVVQLALAFAVAVKHYLRGEEGILYEDLFYLVNFIPALHFPSALPHPHDVSIGPGLSLVSRNRASAHSTSQSGSLSKAEKLEWSGRTNLMPANQPPSSKWSSLISHKPWRSQRYKKDGPRERCEDSDLEFCSEHHGTGLNVPLEVALFMTSWLNTMQHRNMLDVPTVNAFHQAIIQFFDTLAGLENILTTPIPWSYNAHIWEVSWIYCLVLPFQLVDAGFGWVTIGATVVTTYIVFGYASIAEEIENPFGYDKNDLNLGYFCREIIAKELDTITAHPPPVAEKYIFSHLNLPLGPKGPNAEMLMRMPVSEIRAQLAMAAARNGSSPESNCRQSV